MGSPLSIGSRDRAHRKTVNPLGLDAPRHAETFVRQVFDSVRRVEYVLALQTRDVCCARLDPRSTSFDPIRAAVHYLRGGDLEEAAWLTFLSTHFGSDPRNGWGLMRQVYGALDGDIRWDWKTTRPNPKRFSRWLARNSQKLVGRFGNHRKYVSLKPDAPQGTNKTVETYIAWVASYSSHEAMLRTFRERTGTSPAKLFDAFYRDMKRHVTGFGRMGCFDFLCSLGKLGAFPIEPAELYLAGSTGPRKGALVLLRGNQTDKVSAAALEPPLQQLAQILAEAGVRFPMQVLEDAICNWQKSPATYKRFKG